jgi:hypothetical protein
MGKVKGEACEGQKEGHLNAPAPVHLIWNSYRRSIEDNMFELGFSVSKCSECAPHNSLGIS